MNNKGKICGGSWLGPQGDARLGYRLNLDPGSHFNALSFRVAVHNIKKTTILRGGSWFDLPMNVRSAVRHRDHPGARDLDLGFRIKQTS